MVSDILRLWLHIAKLPNRNAVFSAKEVLQVSFKTWTLSQDVEPILRASVFSEVPTLSPHHLLANCFRGFPPPHYHKSGSGGPIWFLMHFH